MKKIYLILFVFLVSVSLVSCDAVAQPNEDAIEASGVVEAVEFSVAPQVSGEVKELYYSEGDKVSAGDVLFILENDTLQAQYDLVLAALDASKANLILAEEGLTSARAGVDSVEIGLDLATLQFESVLQKYQLQELPLREEAWNADVPDEFDLPVWYFQQSDKIAAAKDEVTIAKETLELERSDLAEVLENTSNTDIVAVETRLAQAQVAFEIAESLTDRIIAANERETIDDYVQSLFDSAEAELESAQAEYDNLLSDAAYTDVLEARARVAVAYDRYQLSLGYYYGLLVGEDALEVSMAALSVDQAEALVTQANAAFSQAEAAVEQASKAVSQAKANLDMVAVQMDNLEVEAKTDGVILAKTIEVGELVQPGITVITIGKLDDLTITVYIPEDQYGQILLGDEVEVNVDSYPDEVFTGLVTRIADQAEYTPRNVQTEEDRRTTVFAVEISVGDTEGKLKPGMPADVIFEN